MRIGGMLAVLALWLITPIGPVLAQNASAPGLRATVETTPDMLALDARSSAAIEAGNWVEVEALVAALLLLERSAYGPDDPRVAASHSWLATAISRQGRPFQDYEPHLRQRLRIAERHGDDKDGLGAARAQLAYGLMEAGRAAEAVPLFHGALAHLETRSSTDPDLITVRNSLADALSASDRKPEAVIQLEAVLEAVRMGGDAGATAVAANRLAVRLYELGRYVDAEPAYWVELQKRQEAGGGHTRFAATAAYWLSETLRTLGREPETEPLLEQILALETRALPEERVLSDDQVALSALTLGILRYRDDRFAEAEGPLLTAVTLRRNAPGSLFAPLSWLGMTLRALDRPAEAETVQQEAVQLAETLYGTDHASVAVQLGNLGSTYMDQHKYLDAVRVLRRAVSIADAGTGAEVHAVETLGLALNRAGLYADGETVRRRALHMRLAETPVDPVAVDRTRLNLATSLYVQERYAVAEDLQRQVLTGTTDPKVRADALTDLAMSTYNLGQASEAETLFRDALNATEQAYGPDSTMTAGALLRLGQVLGTGGDWARGDPLLARALQIATDRNDRILVANISLAIGAALSDGGNHEAAVRVFRSAYRVRRELFGPDHPDTVNIVRRMALEIIELGDYAQAEIHLRQIVGQREATFGPDHPQTASALQELALAIFMQDRFEVAIPLMRRALTIAGRGDDPRDHIRMGANLGVTLIRAEHPDQALVVLRVAAKALLERVGGQATGQDGRSDLNGLRYLFRNSVRTAWDASHTA